MFFFFSIATKRRKNGAAATFWTALAASSAELRRQSAAECERRYALLAARRAPTLPRGGEPKVLDAWSRLLDSRCAGHFGGSGRAAWLAVGEEGRLALDPRPGLGCVETLGGRVCELGAPADPGSPALDPPRSKRLVSVAMVRSARACSRAWREARGPPRRGRVVRAGGGVKLFEQRAAELRRRPPVTDREHALADLDAGSRRERERVARRISAA